MATRAIVLGAGGNAASSWQIGVVAGFADYGVVVSDADLFIGTSAGARTAVQLASGADIDVLFERQTGMHVAETSPDIDLARWRREIVHARNGGGTPAKILQRIGSLGLSTAVKDRIERRAFIASEITTETWPGLHVVVAAVEVETGERRTFDRRSSISLLDAVEASGALAGVWPAVPVGNHHYMDGGFYSTDNADLAAGSTTVLVLALRESDPSFGLVPLKNSIHLLAQSGSRVEVVQPDDAVQAVFQAADGNVLDPSIGADAARVAREQGRRIADERIATFWNAIK